MVLTWLRQKGPTFVVCAGLLGLAATACLLPLENGIVVLLVTFFFGLGVILLSLAGNERDRMLLVRLFVLAFVIRLVFTLLAYGLGLINVIGGADDVSWTFSWDLSRYWRHFTPGPPNIRDIPGVAPPQTFLEAINPAFGKNRGFYYLSAYVYSVIEVPSQIALACVNNFFSSLTACVIYRITRLYFTEKASLVAAGAAVIFPGFIAWSALTIKEPWLIFLEIFAFYLWWLAISERRWWLIMPGLFLMLITYSMRFYIGYMMFAAIPFIIVGARSRDPRRTAVMSFVGLGVAYVLGMAVGVIHVDVISIVAENMAGLSTFRGATSGANGTTTGVNSGVVLPYDPSTPQGVFMLVLVGMAYLLLSPFPWALSGKQLLTLPDVAIWWFLVFAYILPGIRYAWQKYPGPSIAIWSYLAPLVLVYSFSFGNIGLAYRQRAQLMPFFLFFAAAGYDARRKKKEELESGGKAGGKPSVEEILEQLRQVARAAPQAKIPGAAAPEPILRATPPRSG